MSVTLIYNICFVLCAMPIFWWYYYY